MRYVQLVSGFISISFHGFINSGSARPLRDEAKVPTDELKVSEIQERWALQNNEQHKCNQAVPDDGCEGCLKECHELCRSFLVLLGLVQSTLGRRNPAGQSSLHGPIH